ncbi:MAG: bifunctional riboflavin kinase/FAD synthetase [Pseudomonadota bacterium]
MKQVLLSPHAKRQDPCVLAIGNFDGVHQGHQSIARRVLELVREGQAAIPAVMLFEPQPLEVIRPEHAPKRLMSLTEKLRQLRAVGIEKVIVLRFNEVIRYCSPAEFVKEILIDRLNIHALIVGDDFRFGAHRTGDYDFLVEASRQFKFVLERAPTYETAGARVSSTRIRTALTEGALLLAEQCLGRPYSISGLVVKGDQIGRTLGIPTANIKLHHVPPLSGVYAVEAILNSGEIMSGVANIGSRPTVQGKELRLETHLFKQPPNLYGSQLRVIFRHKIRDEQRFESLDVLKQAMHADIRTARNFFNLT